MADGAFCGNGAPDLDSRWEVRLRARVSSGVGGGGGLESPGICAPPGAAVSGLQQACSRVYVDKTVHDFLHLADLV